MATYLVNALTFQHDHEVAEKLLTHFWKSQNLLDIDLVREHISSQPILAASLFFLVFSSIALFVFSAIFLFCRFRGFCGAQKYQEYPTNSNNYALHLMLFFLSWIIVTSASVYFVLAGSGFWSEKLDAKKPIPYFINSSSSLRFSRGVSEIFANPDYHGDFENISEEEDDMSTTTLPSNLKRVWISRKFHRHRIEIPMRPDAEISFLGNSDKFVIKKSSTTTTSTTTKKPEVEKKLEEKPRYQMSTFVKNLEEPINDSESESELESESEPETTTEAEYESSEDLIIDGRSMATESASTDQSIELTTKDYSQIEWRKVETTTKKVLEFSKILPTEPTQQFQNLHSRLLIFVCRLTFCFISLLLAFIILPAFFFIVAGTGCYIYSDHPMNRSSISNTIGQIVSTYCSILLLGSPTILIFSSFALVYTHSHETLCAAVQLQNQQTMGIVDTSSQTDLIEAYRLNSAQCSRSLAPVQSLLLSSLLLSISILPCVFSMFKLVKYYYRANSEFYWNAADNYAGRRFSKQEFPHFQTATLYPDEESYAVYGQI
ncbi:unnamed protein product [Caenorhabditis angaria]|uniref:Uncharacterized protein n=1 Tax=Caenorhabditis angaria TaxID=860376 RepID=A0A9P1I9N7_9PELO|nr:unnamed protein product [Caenorhabditis angaria]